MNRALLGLRDPDEEIALGGWSPDPLGGAQVRGTQRHLGLEVWPSELIVHLDATGDVRGLSGVTVPTPAIDPTPSLTAEDATVAAADTTPSVAPDAVEPPQLIVYARNTGEARLAWRTLVRESAVEEWVVVVDATNGTVLARFNRVTTDNVPGSGVDLAGQTRPLQVWEEGGTYYLVDTTKDMYDATSNPPAPADVRGGIVIMDAGNQPPTSDVQQIPPANVVSSGSPTSGWLADAVSAGWSFSGVYDYFRTVHGRLSLDNAGGSIQAIVRVGQNWFNAAFIGELSLMIFGDAVDFAAALDVVAHELAHGVTFTSARLVYQNQSGALNESYSDVFGTTAEAWIRGTAPDWRLGDVLPVDLQRDLQNPSALQWAPGQPYPSRFSEFVQTSQDNGGVHINSSIPNHAFYLLAAGLPNAVGVEKAEKIAYRALTTYLTANSQFVDARLASVQAAEDLYGATEAQAVRDAFDGVEIFDGMATPPPPPFPGTAGEDATLFLVVDPTGDFCNLSGGGGICLFREDPSLEPPDPVGGVALVPFTAAVARPSVLGDGSVAAYLWNYDVCLVDPAVLDSDVCQGFPDSGIFVASVALSPDGQLAGFVLLDESFQPTNRIFILVIPTDEVLELDLQAPALDGGLVASIVTADAMDFTADSRFILYDALNQISGGGSTVSVWSIYAVDLVTGATLSLVPPVPGVDIGYPALSQTSDNFLTFDALDQQSGLSTIYAADLSTGTLQPIGQTQGYGVPSYTGDDAAIVFSLDDAAVGGGTTNTGYSLVARPLAGDRITPSGDPFLSIFDAAFGVVYRRGAWGAPSTTTTTTLPTTTTSLPGSTTTSTSLPGTSTTTSTSIPGSTTTSTSLPGTTTTSVPGTTTTTTLPCLTDAECDDADPCTDDTCEAGGCVSRIRSCFDGAGCLLATAFDMPDCTRKVMRKLGKFTKRAGKKLAKAERKLLAGKLGPVDRLLGKSARQLEKALVFVDKQVTRGKVPAETCGAAVQTAIMDRLTRVNEVRFGDCQP